MHEAIYSSQYNRIDQSTQAVIVLPEIYGVKDFTRRFADTINQKCNILSFAIDHFFPLTRTVSDFDYVSGAQQGIDLMSRYSAKEFDMIFQLVADEIKTTYTSVSSFIVIGFCFGGSLALYSGVFEEVEALISFYPGQALKAQFDGKDSIVEVLAKNRHIPLSVNLIFGDSDQLISAQDRETIISILEPNPCLKIKHRTYEAGHAFMNSDRQTYNESSATLAMRFVESIFDTGLANA